MRFAKNLDIVLYGLFFEMAADSSSLQDIL